jgi:hypothetical protein
VRTYSASAFLLSVLLIACGPATPMVWTFENPAGNDDVAVIFEDSGHGLSIALRNRLNNASTVRWEILREDLDRAWIGWSNRGRFMTVLTCSGFGAQLDRLSLGSESAVDFEKLRIESAEADANLVAGLKTLAGSKARKTDLTPDGIISWFCSAGVDAVLRGPYSTDRPRQYFLPASMAGRYGTPSSETTPDRK